MQSKDYISPQAQQQTAGFSQAAPVTVSPHPEDAGLVERQTFGNLDSNSEGATIFLAPTEFFNNSLMFLYMTFNARN